MGRRRRRVIRIVKRTLPKVFSCPRCGVIAVRVSRTGDSDTVACGSCGLKYSYSPPPKKENIDLYNEFVDMFMAGKVGA